VTFCIGIYMCTHTHARTHARKHSRTQSVGVTLIARSHVYGF